MVGRGYTGAFRARLFTTDLQVISADAAVPCEMRATIYRAAADRKDPVKVSIFDGGHRHRVTIVRNSAGDYVASKRPVGPDIRFSLDGALKQQRASLYTGFYSSALLQKLPPQLIMHILRLHAYDTDFKKRVAAGDGFELFFDVKDGATGTEDELGELLYTSISAAGETREFFRFRTPDGSVDFYDKNGDNVRKFLMRRPSRPVCGNGKILVSRLTTPSNNSAPPSIPGFTALCFCKNCRRN